MSDNHWNIVFAIIEGLQLIILFDILGRIPHGLFG